MAGNQNDFDFGELREPLRRAQQLETQHSLWQKDAEGEEHFSYREALSRYGRYAVSVEWGLYHDRKHYLQVLQAMAKSFDQAARMMGGETSDAWHGVIAGILPMLGQMAAAVGVGALAGGAVGAVAGLGFGDEITIPEGALLGARLALWVTGALGLVELLGQALKNLDSFSRYATEAVEIAWWAGEDPHVEEARDINDAAKLFAVAIAELWMAVLAGIIVWVLHRAGEIASESAGKITGSAAFKQAIGEMQGKTRKLGPLFGDWFAKNFEQIRKLVADRKAKLQEVEGDSAANEGSSGAGTSGTGSSGGSAAPKPTAPSATKTYPDGSVRTADGKFAGKTGVVPGTPGVTQAEGIINSRPGWRVVGKEISVRDADGTLRRYDLVAQNPNGEYVGIEVKSGSARLTAQQSQVDANLNANGGLDTVGQRASNAGIDRISSTETVNVP